MSVIPKSQSSGAVGACLVGLQGSFRRLATDATSSMLSIMIWDLKRLPCCASWITYVGMYILGRIETTDTIQHKLFLHAESLGRCARTYMVPSRSHEEHYLSVVPYRRYDSYVRQVRTPSCNGMVGNDCLSFFETLRTPWTLCTAPQRRQGKLQYYKAARHVSHKGVSVFLQPMLQYPYSVGLVDILGGTETRNATDSTQVLQFPFKDVYVCPP